MFRPQSLQIFTRRRKNIYLLNLLTTLVNPSPPPTYMVGYKAFVKCICGTASLPEDITLQSGAGPDEDAVGFLHKRGGGKHATIWQQRLFVVKRSSMYYYKSRDDISPKGVIRLMGCSYYIVKAATDKKNHFRIKHPSFKTRELSTQTEDQLTLWEVVIQKAIGE